MEVQRRERYSNPENNRLCKSTLNGDYKFKGEGERFWFDFFKLCQDTYIKKTMG